MMKHWTKVKLGDVADVVGGGTPNTSEPIFWGGNIPWLTPKDLSGYTSRYISMGSRHISAIGLESSSAKLMPKGSVLLTSRAPVGYVAIADVDLCTNQGFKSLVLKDRNVPEFFYYLLKYSRAYIESMASGSTFMEISGASVKALEFYIPPIDEQERIAGVLGSLDDKIELLREQNRTLEEMAKAIFKSWFVDFDIVKAKAQGLPKEEIINTYKINEEIYDLFPSSFQDSPLGSIPTNWEVKTLGEVSHCFDNKRIPLSKMDRAKRKGIIPYYGATSIMDYVDAAIFDGIYLLVGEDGSVAKSDGTPFLQYIWGQSWVNNHAHVLQGAAGVSTEYLYLLLLGINISPYITGAVQAKLNQGNMNIIPLVLASKSLNRVFGFLIGGYFKKIRINTSLIRELSMIRDLSITKLMSGQVQI